MIYPPRRPGSTKGSTSEVEDADDDVASPSDAPLRAMTSSSVRSASQTENGHRLGKANKTTPILSVYAICQLTVVFTLLPHEWAPLPHRVVPLAVLALDPQDVKQGSGGAKTVAAVDLRVQILKKSF